jgi:hypothetical protein
MNRGGGAPIPDMAVAPRSTMDPPPRSPAADAHDCIMVPIQPGRPNTSLWRGDRATGKLPSDITPGGRHQRNALDTQSPIQVRPRDTFSCIAIRDSYSEPSRRFKPDSRGLDTAIHGPAGRARRRGGSELHRPAWKPLFRNGPFDVNPPSELSRRRVDACVRGRGRVATSCRQIATGEPIQGAWSA